MTFSLDWLELREPADHAARDRGLLAAAARWLAAENAALAVDLGAGSGSTVRAFGDLARGARWRLVDRDPVLLAAASARLGPWVESFEADLGVVDALPLAGARLVAASALFDLVSMDWIEGLARRLATERLGLYAALTYSGATDWTPALPEDAAVLAAFNAHQRRDKGLGPALGPEAGPALMAALSRRGFAVQTAASAWRLGPGDAALQRALAEGIAQAASEAGMEAARAWGQARRAAAMAGACFCTVGHVDVLALPA